MVGAAIALDCDSTGPFARPDVVAGSPSAPVPPAAPVAVAVAVAVVVAIVGAAAVVAAVAAAAAAVVAAVVLDLSIGSAADSARGGRRASPWERPGTAQRPVFDSAGDRRTPTWMEMDMNVAMDTRSVVVTDCCSVATSPAERIGDTAATGSTTLSFEDPDVLDEVSPRSAA